MNPPLISVIIPVYNHATDLVACLRALQEQSYSTFEIIVVDDGSTDRPKETVQTAGMLTDVARWIELDQNSGAPVARNTGFAASSGSYVIFLDADARMRRDGLEQLLTALLDHPDAAFSYSAFRFGSKLFLSQAFSAQSLVQSNYIHTSGLIRRDAFLGFDESLKKFQDWDLWLRIAEQGGVGVYVPELLLEIGERAQYGMSRWIPSFMYALPWKWIGMEPASVTKYRLAEQIIRTKHHDWMECVSAKIIRPTLSARAWICLGLVLMLGSALTLGTLWNGIIAGALAFVVLIVAYKKPTFALTLLAFELILGSRGGWFKIGANVVNDGGIAIRILVFVAFFLGWSASMMFMRQLKALWQFCQEEWLIPFAGLGIVVIWAVVRGVFLHQPFLASDANAWGFFLAIIPAGWLWKQEHDVLTTELRTMIPAAIGFLTMMTLALFVVFAQSGHFMGLTGGLYAWIRQSGLGEITSITHGVYRVFFAGQILLVAAWLWMYVRATQDHRPFTIKVWLAWMLLGATIVISLSRSFWLGMAISSLMIAGASLVQRPSAWKEVVMRTVVRPLVSLVGSFLLIFLVATFALSSALGSRFSNGEAAVSSRWNLIPVMEKGIAQHPLLGSGFGATLTYQSHDPRVVAKTGGVDTTYAFEWGWLNIWYKMGIFGLLTMIWLLGSIVIRAAELSVQSRVFVWSLMLVLATIHIFTPYLDHPLGIGLLLFATLMTVYKKTPGEELVS